MKKSTVHYKVVNAVINAISGNSTVYYVSGGQGGSGAGSFSYSDDFDVVRDNLLAFDFCEKIDREDIAADFDDGIRNDDTLDFYELYDRGDNGASIQIAVCEDDYVDSYELRDMIAYFEDLECAEITEGRGGYPRNLRGCVLFRNGMTYDDMQKIAERYGVEIVKLCRREGNRLWQSEGWENDLLDYQRMFDGDSKFTIFNSFRNYADYIREIADELDDEDEIERFHDFLHEIEGKELGENEMIVAYNDDIYDYDVEYIKCASFTYDVNHYTLALDCKL